MIFNQSTFISTQNLCFDILQKSKDATKPNKLFEKFQYIELKVNELIDIQKNYACVQESDSREKYLYELLEHAKNKKQVDGVTIKFSSKLDGYGMFATRKIDEHEKLMEIPINEMITEFDVYKTELKSIVLKEITLKNMPNLSLTLFLMNEIRNKSSKYAKYLNSLPEKPSSIMYMNSNDMKILQNSQYFPDIIDLYCKMCCHYCYLFKLLEKYDSKDCKLANNFCFEDYRWAASILMTRNNQIPCTNENRNILCLIPIWDMMNYSEGNITTDFDDEKKCLIYYSMKDYKEGDEIYMGLGARSTLDYFLYSGFVPVTNPHDSYYIRIGFPTTDGLYKKKMEILSNLDIPESISTKFTIDYQNETEPVISTNLRIYLTIMLLKKEEQLDQLLMENINLKSKISDLINLSNDNIDQFFKNRINMLCQMLKKKLDSIESSNSSFEQENTQSIKLVQHEYLILIKINSKL